MKVLNKNKRIDILDIDAQVGIAFGLSMLVLLFAIYIYLAFLR